MLLSEPHCRSHRSCRSRWPCWPRRASGRSGGSRGAGHPRPHRPGWRRGCYRPHRSCRSHGTCRPCRRGRRRGCYRPHRSCRPHGSGRRRGGYRPHRSCRSHGTCRPCWRGRRRGSYGSHRPHRPHGTHRANRPCRRGRRRRCYRSHRAYRTCGPCRRGDHGHFPDHGCGRRGYRRDGHTFQRRHGYYHRDLRLIKEAAVLLRQPFLLGRDYEGLCLCHCQRRSKTR